MHGDALEMRVDRGEQADDFYFAALAKHVEGPGTVFAAAPGEKDLSLQSEALAGLIRTVKKGAGEERPRPHNF